MTYGKLPAALMLGLFALAGSATAAPAGDVVAARQGHYKELGKAFKAINEQIKAATPDLAVISANARTVTQIGQQQHRENWFPKGTEAGKGLQTAAKPSIWTAAADFKAKRIAFAKATAGYAGIAAKGDIEAIKAATAGVGANCKSCHETYRDQNKS
ncbi:c-type cytochrome [Sphingomonas immobilis]|uniref:Cytochrome c n=1 Tax=Sphingomonas immobilis TaxID=3063997 RepID=A0ABT9A1S0_9SPHN|nr:cytochrome c [Sphingomonas sp. CA1-15]MDO7843200.1 cytochrome c [Sphingomonas sp. CA1-15]